MKQKKLLSIVAGILAFLMIFALIISILPAQIFAANRPGIHDLVSGGRY